MLTHLDLLLIPSVLQVFKRAPAVPRPLTTLPRPAAVRLRVTRRLTLPDPHAISVFSPEEPSNSGHRLRHHAGARVRAHRPPRLLGEGHRHLPHLLDQQVRRVPGRLFQSRLAACWQVLRDVSRLKFDPGCEWLLAADVAWPEVQPTVSTVAANRAGTNDHLDAAAPSPRAAAHIRPVFPHEQRIGTSQVSSNLNLILSIDYASHRYVYTIVFSFSLKTWKTTHNFCNFWAKRRFHYKKKQARSTTIHEQSAPQCASKGGEHKL